MARLSGSGQHRLQPVHFLAEDGGKRALGGRQGLIARASNSLFQRLEPQPAMRLDGDHGNAELTAQPVRVNSQALVLGHIDHRERNDDRQAQFENLADQIEIPLQVVRRDHAEHDVRSRHVG